MMTSKSAVTDMDTNMEKPGRGAAAPPDTNMEKPGRGAAAPPATRHAPTSCTRCLVRPGTFLAIWAVIVCELFAYLCVRVYIHVAERTVLRCRGVAARRAGRRLAEAQGAQGAGARGGGGYRRWFAAASELDRALGMDEGSLDDHSDADRVVIELADRLKKSLFKSDASSGAHALRRLTVETAEALAQDLRTACSPHLGSVGAETSYRYNHRGTNAALHEFVDLVDKGLLHLLRAPVGVFPSRGEAEDGVRGENMHTTANRDDAANRLRLFRALRDSFGSSALCMSGGASNGYYHLGVVKTLLHYDMLPQVITGSSAGSLIGAAVATRTDTELSEFLDQDAGDLASFFQPIEGGWLDWARRWFRTGAAIDPTSWHGKLHRLCGGAVTFREAWQRTGRDFFVCVYDGFDRTRVLNWRTTPDVLIASAVIASSALPHVIHPQRLQVKTRTGDVVDMEGPDRYCDGSLKHDVPLEQLNRTFSLNCRFTIVSMVEPHILPFFYFPRGQPGSPELFRNGHGLRGGFLPSLAERVLKLDLQKWLAVLRDLGINPGNIQGFDDAFLQQTWGDVTILAPMRVVDGCNMFSNPSASSMADQVVLGQSSTWPKLCMISHRHRVEKRLAMCCREAAAGLIASRSGMVEVEEQLDEQLDEGWAGVVSPVGTVPGGRCPEGVAAASRAGGSLRALSVHQRRHLMHERDMAHALLEQQRERTHALQQELDSEQMRRMKSESQLDGLSMIIEQDTTELIRRRTSSPPRRMRSLEPQ